MEAERWKRLEEAFAAASEVAGAERDAVLDRLCGTDAALRAEVDALLQANDAATEVIAGAVESEAREAVAALPAAEAGLQFGPYQVIRRLGRGGMGDVYLAARADDQYQKQVAVKVVRRGRDSEQMLDRFRYERQILANLDHPNIARLLDGGVTADGLPYLVMEYVSGVPIHEYCDAQSLPLAARLRLFLDTCSAVEYAHRNLVVHRDIKPSNILVTAERVPKLLDFGIAKLLSAEPDDPSLTQTGMTLLTPDYASPEQVKGEAITTATDVYSLGVLLFQLLTGRRPYTFRDTSLAAVQQAICEAQPLRPSRVVAEPPEELPALAAARGLSTKALRRALAGDLDHIVLTALRKEPERRYASAGQFAEDLRRYLRHLPVQASADSWRYRAGKFVQRHRLAVAFAAVFVVTVVGFAFAVWRQSVRIASERDAALTERRKSEETVKFFLDLFRLADPGETQGNAITARAILDKGAQRVKTELRGQPEVQASMMEAIGQVYGNLGLDKEAAAQLEGALAVRRRVGGVRSVDFMKTQQLVAQLDFDRGDYAKARAASERTLAYWRTVKGAQSSEYAEALLLLAKVDAAVSQYDRAKRRFAECLAIERRLHPGDDLDLAMVLNDYGLLLYDTHQLEAAEAMHREALAMRQRQLGAVDPRISESLNNLSIALSSLGKYDDARRVQTQALELDQRIYGADHPYVATDLNNLGMVEYLTHHDAAAERLLRRGLAMRLKLLGREHPDTVISVANLAKALTELKRFPEAEAMQRDALALNTKLYGPKSPNVARCLNVLGGIYFSARRYDDSERTFRAALALYPGMKASPMVVKPDTVFGLGRVLLKRNRAAEAEPLLREAVRLREELQGKGGWRLAWEQAVLAECLALRGRKEEARTLAAAAEPVIRAQRGEKGLEFAKVQEVLRMVGAAR